MNQADYDQEAGDLMKVARAIEDAKRPGYTIGNEDVLANFKNVAARIGITPEQAWLVYFLKHVDAITAVMGKPDLPVSEGPLGRFADAVNYLRLGWALHVERDNRKTSTHVATTLGDVRDMAPDGTNVHDWTLRAGDRGGSRPRFGYNPNDPRHAVDAV